MNVKSLFALLALAPLLAAVTEADPSDRRRPRSYRSTVENVLGVRGTEYGRGRGISVRTGRAPLRCATPPGRVTYAPRNVWVPGRYQLQERNG